MHPWLWPSLPWRYRNRLDNNNNSNNNKKTDNKKDTGATSPTVANSSPSEENLALVTGFEGRQFQMQFQVVWSWWSLSSMKNSTSFASSLDAASPVSGICHNWSRVADVSRRLPKRQPNNQNSRLQKNKPQEKHWLLFHAKPVKSSCQNHCIIMTNGKF